MCFAYSLRRILAVLMLMVFFTSVGGHWCILQGVAWIRMAHEFAKRDTVSHALRKTLNGENPCKLCHKIDEGRSKAAKTNRELAEVRGSLLKDPGLVAECQDTVRRPPSAVVDPMPAPLYESRSDQPPVPPPRAGSFS